MNIKQWLYRTKQLIRNAVTAMLIGLPISLQADTEPLDINIQSQKLGSALMELAERAGVEVIIPQGVNINAELSGISGTYTLRAALDEMLKGQSLSYQFTSDRTVVIKNASQAGASQSGDSDNVMRKGARVIEEVMVTAEKRSESMQDIPIAISAYSGQSLERAGVLGIEDLQFQSTSLQVGNSGAGEVMITMRGITNGLINLGSEPGSVVSQDGVPFARLVLMDTDFLDVDRVEVLRGPQGTIAGRNASGGAINIHSKRPTEEFAAGIKTTVGNYGRFATESYLNGQILDSGVSGRVVISTDNADGWLKNTYIDEELATKDKVHARASLLADINDNLEALLIFDVLRDKSVPQSLFSYGRIRSDTPSLGEFTGVAEIDADSGEFAADQRSHGDKKQYGATLKLDWEVSPTAMLASTTGYWDMDFEHGYDCDGTRLAVCGLPRFDFNSWQFTQELTLTADLTEKLDIVAGGFYLRENAKQPTVFTSSEYLGFNLVSVGQPEQNLTSYAGYGQLRYQFTENMRLSVGARYTRDTKEYRDDVGLDTFEESWTAFTPRVAIDYTATDDLTLYASIARGFKAGGFNTFQVPQAPYNPEFVWSYEVGAKGLYFDDRLRISGSAFFMDYTDLQQSTARLVEGPNGPLATIQVANAGAAEIKGMELELEALLSDALRLKISGTWLDAKTTINRVTDDIFPELGVPDSITGLNVRDLSGSRLPRVPEWQWAFSGEYTQPLTERLTGIFRLDYSWRSDAHLTLFNHNGDLQDAYGLLNLFMAIETDDGRWQLSTFAHNVLDERYITHRGPNPAGLAPVPFNLANFGAPRTYGLSLAFKF